MRRSTGFGELTAALFIVIGVYLSPLEPNILHLQFAFSEQAFNDVLSKWQSVGVARYRTHIPADFLLLTVYGMFGYRYGREHATEPVRASRSSAILILALPLAAVADAVENTLHLVLTVASTPASPSGTTPQNCLGP